MLSIDKAVRWGLFFLNPFSAMLISLKEYMLPYSKNIFWAFCVFYGLTFTIGFETAGSDINRYIEELQYLNNRYEYSTNDIINYFQASGEVDVLRIFLSYIISRFTDSGTILTTVYAIIFGFFYSRNIWYVFGLLDGKLSLLEKLILFSFILIIPIWLLNGFRMWTAFHIFFYGLLPFIFENKKSKLIFVYLSFFVHFSYIIPIGIVLLYILLGNRLNIYFIVFLVSFFISEINITFFNQYIENYAPRSIVDRSSSYRNEDVIEAEKEASIENTKRWYVKWHSLALRWALFLSITFLFIFGNPIIKIYPEWRKLFSFVLLFFSFGNILMLIPSGGRFNKHASFLALIMIVLYLNQYYSDIKFKRLITILSPVFLLFIIVSVRMGFYFTSITTIIGNPLIAVFNIGETVSLNDLIK